MLQLITGNRIALHALGVIRLSSVVTGPPTSDIITIDPLTSIAYQTAIATAALGAKRVAAAQAIVASFGRNLVLTLFQDGVAQATANFPGRLIIATDGTEIWLELPAVLLSQAIDAAVDYGTWTFTLAGSATSTAVINGSVGTASPAALILSITSLALDITGFDSTLHLVVPSSMDSGSNQPTLSWVNFANNTAVGSWAFDGVNTARFYYSGGTPTGITATLDGNTLVTSNFAVTSSYGSGNTIRGIISFQFNNPAPGSYSFDVVSTGLYSVAAPTVTLLTDINLVQA